MEERGITVPFATSDGAEKQYMDDGCVEIHKSEVRSAMEHIEVDMPSFQHLFQ